LVPAGIFALAGLSALAVWQPWKSLLLPDPVVISSPGTDHKPGTFVGTLETKAQLASKPAAMILPTKVVASQVFTIPPSTRAKMPVPSGLSQPTSSIPPQAGSYVVDPMYSAAVFKIGHLGLSWTHGRFDDISGGFVLDAADPGRSSFTLTIKADSINTGNPKRDGHLKSADFFNSKQFPLITFKSTAVEAIAGGFDVTGDLTLHGVPRSVTLPLRGGRIAQFPPGTQRIGFTLEAVLRRSEYGMDRMQNAIGDEVRIQVSFEGMKN
jgi:polyisoprenoid-binding protein YceI